eukprot:3017765-Pyramimonas_sp.AAC.2
MKRAELSQMTVRALTAALFYTTTVVMAGLEDQMLPGGSVFGLLVVYAAAYFTGVQINQWVPLVPTLVGQLIAGASTCFVFRSVPGVDFGADISKNLSKNFRGVALAFILSRAGLGLDIQ